YDAKGLLLAAIRDEDPILFMEPKRVYRAARSDVPEGEYTVPLGKAVVLREGSGVTILSYGAMVHVVNEALPQMEAAGFDPEISALRSLLPLDGDTVIESVKKTGRAVVVNEAPKTCGYAAELAATIMEKAFLHLEAPVMRLTGFDTPFPYTLEMDYLPDAARVVDAVRRTVEF